MDVGGVRDDRKWCCFHPGEHVVGVCAMCLNERLLVIAPKRSRIHQTNKIYGISPRRALPKIFTTLRAARSQTEEEQRRKAEVYGSSSTSPEDSFISIKFEENGVASWDKGKASNMTLEEASWKETAHHDKAAAQKKTKTRVILEQMKPQGGGGAPSMSWRKRIGELLHLMKLNKRSNKGRSIGHVVKELEGSKVRYGGWIRNLTTRRTKE